MLTGFMLNAKCILGNDLYPCALYNYTFLPYIVLALLTDMSAQNVASAAITVSNLLLLLFMQACVC